MTGPARHGCCLSPRARRSSHPLVWIAEEDADAEQLVALHHGRAHGDLHLDNIFIRFSPRPRPIASGLSICRTDAARAAVVGHLRTFSWPQSGSTWRGSRAGYAAQLGTRILDAATGAEPGPGTLQGQGLEQLTRPVAARWR